MNFAVNQKASNFGSNVIKELAHAFSCAYIELWMYLGSLESTQEARVALGCASSNSPNLPRASITRYTHAEHEQILKLKITLKSNRRLPRKLLGMCVKPGTGPEHPGTLTEHPRNMISAGSYNLSNCCN